MRRKNDLGRDPIGPLVLRIALPSMLAQFVSVLYSIVDRMYIGHIPGVGDLALAGVGVCGPVVTMIGSAASLIGVGGAPLMSMRMGEGETEQAQPHSGQLLFDALRAVGGADGGCLRPCREPMLMLFGASEATFPFAGAYFSAYLCGTPFALLSTGMCQFIICQGFAGQAMLSVVLGAVMNIVLDPVFIYVLDMGVTGAAVATVISQVGSCAFVLAFLFGSNAACAHHLCRAMMSRVMRRVLLIGFTPFADHRRGQRDDHRHERRAQALWRRGAGRHAAHLRHHRAELHAGGHHAAGRHQQQHANHPELQLRRAQAGPRAGGAKARLCAVRRLYGPDDAGGLDVRRRVRAPVHHGRRHGGPGGVGHSRVQRWRCCRWAFNMKSWTALPRWDRCATRFRCPSGESWSTSWRCLRCPAAFGARAAFFAEPVSDVLGPAVSIAVYLLAIRRILQRRGSGPQGV